MKNILLLFALIIVFNTSCNNPPEKSSIEVKQSTPLNNLAKAPNEHELLEYSKFNFDSLRINNFLIKDLDKLILQLDSIVEENSTNLENDNFRDVIVDRNVFSWINNNFYRLVLKSNEYKVNGIGIGDEYLVLKSKFSNSYLKCYAEDNFYNVYVELFPNDGGLIFILDQKEGVIIEIIISLRIL